jgi:hypothetical protein
LHGLRCGLTHLRHGIEGKCETTPVSLTTLSCFFHIYCPISLSHFSRREGGRGTVGYHLRRCRLHKSYHASFIAPQCNNRVGEAARLRRHGKNDFMHHLTPHTTHPLYPGIQQPYLEHASQLPWGLPKLRVRRKNPPIGSEPPKATRAWDEATQRMANSWHTRSPNEGTRPHQASYLSLDREASFTPLHVDWH